MGFGLHLAGLLASVLLFPKVSGGENTLCPVMPPCSCVINSSGRNDSSANVIVCTGIGMQEDNLPPSPRSDVPFFKVNFSRNSLQDIGDSTYFNSIRDLNSIDLSHNLLGVIPHAVRHLTNLSHLYLQDNHLDMAATRSFLHMENLKFLDLSENRMESVTRGMFLGLSSVNFLILNDNDIEFLEPGALKETPMLKYLYISGNKIKVLQTGAFIGLSNIERLDVSRNMIAHIQANVFAECGSLKQLILDENEMEQINETTFSGLTGLATCALSLNYVGKVAKGAFSSMTKLKFLDLYGNEIDHLDIDSIRGAESSISWLNLGSNYLHEFPSSFFHLFPALDTLLLDINPLTRIPDVTMNKQLHYLSVTGTRIETIYACELAGISITLMWGSSPIKCDCSTKFMKLYHEKMTHFHFQQTNTSMGETFGQSLVWRCASPARLHGKKFTEVLASEFTCPPGEEPHYCRPEGVAMHEPMRVLLTLAQESPISYRLEWRMWSNFNQMQKIDNLTVTCHPLEQKRKSVDVFLPLKDNSTILDGLDYGTRYNICVIYYSLGSATGVSYVLAHNCTQVTTVPYSTPVYVIAVPVTLAAVLLLVVGLVVCYFRLRTAGRPRSGANISGVENFTYENNQMGTPSIPRTVTLGSTAAETTY